MVKASVMVTAVVYVCDAGCYVEPRVVDEDCQDRGIFVARDILSRFLFVNGENSHDHVVHRAQRTPVFCDGYACAQRENDLCNLLAAFQESANDVVDWDCCIARWNPQNPDVLDEFDGTCFAALGVVAASLLP